MAKLYVVGIGPGDTARLTAQADAALRRAEVICGYTVYVDLVAPRYPGKEYLTTPMRRETERCRLALERAQEGKTVAMVCSGDAGVYGMAGPVLELSGDYPEVEVEIVPGVTAALAGAALAGAPLGNDFCVISLSDLLTPWETIERRLRFASLAGFAICLYNPGSHRRTDHLRRACAVLLENLPGDTVCAVTRSIGREGESKTITTLSEVYKMQVDMFTTIFIGTSETKCLGETMVTPRGYPQQGPEKGKNDD